MDSQKILNMVAKGGIIAFAGIFVSKAFTYLYRIVVAQGAGADAYGQLWLAVAVMNIGTTLGLLALDEGVNKFVAQYMARDNFKAVKGVAVSALEISIPASIVVGVVMYLSSGMIATRVFSNPSVTPLIQMLAAVPVFSSFSSVCIDTLNAYKKVNYQVFTNQIFQPLVQLGVTAALLFGFGYGVLGAAIGWVAGTALSSLLAFYFLERKVKPIITSKIKAERNYRELIEFSSPLMMADMVQSTLGRIDTVLLGVFLTDTVVGLYNAAFPTAILIAIPRQAVAKLSLPSFAEARERDDISVAYLMKNMTRWSFMLSFPLFILIGLFSSQILQLLFGKDFVDASFVMILLATGNIISVSTGFLSDVLKSIDETNILFVNTMSSLVMNTFLNVLFIPEFGLGLGMLGAGLATMTTSIIMSGVVLAETYYYEGVTPFHRDMWKPVAASIIPVGIIYFSTKTIFETTPVWVLVPGGIVFGVLYLLTLVLLGGVNEEERDIMVGIGRRLNREKEAEKLAEIVIR